jgi:hypothetical protein
MNLNQAVQSLSDLVNLNEPKKNLIINFRDKEILSLLGGLIEVEVDLMYNNSKKKVALRIRAPSFVKVIRKTAGDENETLNSSSVDNS